MTCSFFFISFERETRENHQRPKFGLASSLWELLNLSKFIVFHLQKSPYKLIDVYGEKIEIHSLFQLIQDTIV